MGKNLCWVVVAAGVSWLWLTHLPGWLGKAWSSLPGSAAVIAERQELMKNNAAHFRDLRQKTSDGQFTRMAVNAQSILMNTRRIPTIFPPGSAGTADLPSRAKPDIWQHWEEFTALAKQAQVAAAALMELAVDADTKPITLEQVTEATKTLGETCKTCHSKFRQPER
jgi:cytochrome c556